jgi:hypothetical protein
LYALRRLVQGDSETPKGALGNNVRALQPLHHRTVRTNIDFTNSVVILKNCYLTIRLIVVGSLISKKEKG